MSWRTFKQSSAAAGEQRIAAKKIRLTVETQMSQSVTWCSKYGKLPLAYEDSFAFFDYLRDSLILCLCRSVHYQMRKMGAQFRHAASMIVMVMRQQNGFWLPAVLFYCAQDRGRFSGIDNDASTVVVNQNPDVIVLKGWNTDKIHTLPLIAWRVF
ncbi:hypothetical protein N037_17810 [Enterobacter sp. EGD-HP1]|nr:hypothetical protein N037_17810 [Enterobacter sp. EGD-HP1]